MSEEIPLFKIKSSLLPNLNIDYTLLGYKSPAHKDLFSYELYLRARYLERIKEIETLKHLHSSKVAENDQVKRRTVGEEFKKMLGETQKRIEERNQSVQISSEREMKIKQLMAVCPGIKDTKEAVFYLEAQNFNVESAKAFYTSCTGRSDIARNNNVVLRFIMPEKKEFSYTFDSNSLMWSMLEVIHKNLLKKKNFKVVIKSNKKEIPIEEMTRKTFANYSLTSNTILSIIYI